MLAIALGRWLILSAIKILTLIEGLGDWHKGTEARELGIRK